MTFNAVIVEDNSTSADIVLRQLETMGFASQIAQTAEEGYALIQSVDPILVVIDERLPDTSGIELIRTLRSEKPDLTIIMSTIVDDERSIKSAFAAGCNYYAIKPNGFRKLCQERNDANKLLNAQVQELFTK